MEGGGPGELVREEGRDSLLDVVQGVGTGAALGGDPREVRGNTRVALQEARGGVGRGGVHVVAWGGTGGDWVGEGGREGWEQGLEAAPRVDIGGDEGRVGGVGEGAVAEAAERGREGGEAPPSVGEMGVGGEALDVVAERGIEAAAVGGGWREEAGWRKVSLCWMDFWTIE